MDHRLLIFNPIFFFLFVSSLAEIRYTQIRSQNRSLHFIDVFGFTQTGRLELNLSHISFSNPNPNPNPNLLNLSHTGFFFGPRLGDWMDGENRTQAEDWMDEANKTQVCYLQSSDFINIVHTFDKHQQQPKSLDVEFSMSDPDIFSLYFENCLPQLQVSMDIRSAMYNLEDTGPPKNYLSDGKNPLFAIYLIYILIYLCFFLLWIRHALHPNTSRAVFPIHYVILVFVLFKVLGFVIEWVNLYYLKNIGYPNTLLLLFLSVSCLFNGVDLYALVGLFGSGWSFLRPKMKFQEKILLAIVISVRLFANALNVFKSVSWPCGDWCISFRIYSHFLDLVAFLALQSPIICTTWHLLRAGRAEGKASLSFRKVKLFRHLFFFVFFYNVFSVYVVNHFEYYASLTRDYWVGVMVGESTILALYVFIGYKFWPEVRNKRLVINHDEEMSAIDALKDEKAYDLMELVVMDYASLQ